MNGPIDVGYGNYILTAPAERQGRKRRRKKKKDDSDEAHDENENNAVDDIKERDSNMRREKKLVTRVGKTMLDGKYDVSELLSTANTLTNPNNAKSVYNKSEL